MADAILTSSGAIAASTLPASLSFDWRAILAVLLIIGLGLLIVAIKTRATPENSHNWIFYCGAVLGLTGGAMSIYYGIYKGDSIISVLSALAFIAMAVFRIVGMESAVHYWQQGRHSVAFVGITGVLLCWVFIYVAGSFEGQADGAAKSEAAALSSPQVQAINAQIATATAQLATLGGFANGAQAAQSTRATNDLTTKLQAAQARLNACNPLIVSKCVNPRTADVQALEVEIDKAKAYGTGNADYLAATALLADLQSQKAKLINSGAATVGKVGKDVEFMAWALGTTDKAHASRVLWLLYVGFMDVLSTIAHLYGALIKPTSAVIVGQVVRRFDSLMRAGFSEHEAHSIMVQRKPLTLENGEGRDDGKKQLPQGVSDETQAAHNAPHVKVGKPDDLPHVKVGSDAENEGRARGETQAAHDSPHVKVGLGDDAPHVKVGNAVCEDCAASFTSRVAWQVRCPDCQAKKRALNATGRRAKGATA
jgi:hypothetical protein